MKPLTKKLVLSALVAVFVWFSLSEHGGFVRRLLSYVYDMDYYLAEASEGQDFANDMGGQRWIPVGESMPIEGDYEITTYAASSWIPSDVDDDGIIYIVVEITEDSKDGPDACAPEGYFHDREVVPVPEGAMHSTAVLSIRPLIETSYVCEAGVHNCPMMVH